MNVFVLYSPGTGGNHLANLISTDPNLNTRWHKDDYNQMDDNAHTTNENLSKPIETWYNKRRIHSTLGYKTINEFEIEMYNQIVAA